MRFFLTTTLVFILFQFNVTGQEGLLSSDFYEVLNTSDDVLLLDVRTKEKFREDRIPGAVSAEGKTILLNRVNHLGKNAKILVYCDHGKRSASALKILKKEGFSNLFHLKEGYIKWKEKGFPVDDTLMENIDNDK